MEIRSGEKTELKLTLVPGGAISGRVLDEDEDPLPGCYVQAHPAKQPNLGAGIQGAGRTDAGGRFRMYGFAPGKYIVQAICGLPFQPRSLSAGPDPPPSFAYPAHFYPAGGAATAEPIEVTAGGERAGVDFRMKPVPVTEVRGRFSPAGVDWRSRSHLRVQMAPVNRDDPALFLIDSRVNEATGTFDFRGVLQGPYFVIAESRDGDSVIGAARRIEVGSKTAEVVLDLEPGVALSGVVQMDDSERKDFALDRTGVELVSEIYLGNSGVAAASSDGAFTLRPVVPARWRLRVNAPPAFVKSAWLGAQEITGRAFDIAPGERGPLKIVLSTNTGAVQGTGPPGCTVWAVRVREGPRQTGDMGANVDPSGHFSVRSLAPGKYRLVAAPAGAPQPYDEGNLEITIHEGETVTADVKVPEK